MVSHQPSESEIKMDRTSRAEGQDKERRAGDSIYRSHPIPSMPVFTSRSRPAADSMLTYTKRMRQISKFRTDSGIDDSSPQTILEIQARHIPKTGQGQYKHSSKKPQQRRPLSLDELIGRQPKKDEASASSPDRRKDRRVSEPIITPSLAPPSKRDKEKEEKRIRINFVSASDLFDLVDFSLRRKKMDPENIQLARAEDALKFIRDANYFRSTAGRRRMKPVTEEEAEVDRASLVVQGTSSPRDNSRDSSEVSKEKLGGWASQEMASSTADLYESDDEDDDDKVTNGDWPDREQITNKRMMLLQPQKLRFRPKRAKRMKLHRSLLSAIPEDGWQRRGSHAASSQDSSVVRVPVIPSASSLAAIKGSEQSENVFPDTEMKKIAHRKDSNTQRSSDEELLLPCPRTKNGQENCMSKDRLQNRCVEVAVNGSQKISSDLPHKEQHLSAKADHLHSSQKKDAPEKTAAGSKPSSLGGRSVLLEPWDAHQKKIRKIIFLRDLPEPSPHRYS